MLIQHVALVSDDNGPSASELACVAAALQRQVMRDLAPLWGVTATVHAFPYLEDVPLGYWPIIITGRELGGQAGVHLDDNGQPYAHIQVSPTWSLQASSVCLEMLVNPSEDRLVVGPSPRRSGTLAEFLVEVCGPCDPERGYAVNGVVVSDFCTPAFFGLQLSPRGDYSVNGSATAPFGLANFGHLTWREPTSGSWWLRSHWTDNPIDTQLGVIDKRFVSVRQFVQTCGAGFSAPAPVLREPRAMHHHQASRLRAARLRSLPEARVETTLEGALNFLQRRHNEADMGASRPEGPREHLLLEEARELVRQSDVSPLNATRSRGLGEPPALPVARSALPPSIVSARRGFGSAARSGALLLGGTLAGGLVVLGLSAIAGRPLASRTAAEETTVVVPAAPVVPPLAKAVPPSAPDLDVSKAVRPTKLHGPRPTNDRVNRASAATDAELDALIGTRR